MKQTIIFGVILLLGAAGTAYYLQLDAAVEAAPDVAKAEPLYWVAPMDPNFRRDQPGKSPMGMDLVPVYANDEDDQGVVRISPTVEHNIGVRTASARLGRLTDVLTTVAYVQFDEKGLWHAYPRVEGWIDRLYAETVGEAIEKNDPLYDIYAPALVNVQEEYIAALRSGNQALINSSTERLRTLQVPGASIEELKRTRKVQQTITVRAPQSGVVSKLNVRDGHFVTPGTKILEIAALDNVWLTAEVFSRDAGSVHLGSEMEVRFDALPGAVRLASVDFISPVIDAVSRTLQVRASLANPTGELKPNMFAQARFLLKHDAEVVLIPRDAVIRTADQDRVVLAMGEGGYKSVAVTPGRFGTNDVEILKGLSPGDEVVTSAHFLIDSESSIASDFRRMDLAQVDHGAMDHSTMDPGAVDHGTMDHGAMDHSTMDHGAMDHRTMDHGAMDHSTMDHGTGAQNESPGVWVTGSVRSVDAGAKTINLRHDPIPAWNWPAMIMTMDAGDGVDLQILKPGSGYRFHLMEQTDAPTGYRVMHAEPVDPQ